MPRLLFLGSLIVKREPCFDWYRSEVTRRQDKMQPDIAQIAGLIGDKARAKMLLALMSGKAHTATELSVEADITPQTASSHLTKLVEGELLIVRKQGRHRYFQLKDAQVAELIEQLLAISANHTTRAIHTGPEDHRLRQARVCYNHLAGEVAVNVFDALITQGFLTAYGDQALLTERGEVFFQQLGATGNHASETESPQIRCKACLDWSERRSHLAGELGQWILRDLLSKGWGSRALDSRAVEFSAKGLNAFYQQYRVK